VAETYTLEAEFRTVVGKKVGQLRRQGLVPVVVYGPRVEATHLQIPARVLKTTLLKAGGTSLINLTVGDKNQTVLAREVQRDIIRGDILHVDFIAVDESTRIRTAVPIRYIGESPAVAGHRGILATGTSTMNVETTIQNLITHIDVDVSVLVDIGDAIHVGDLTLGEGIKPVDDADELLVRVAPIPVVHEEEVAPEAGAVGPAEPEVIQKGKIEEEEAE
jgi:large subunit ribosomal protein L25